ncbi:hypothetical protein AVEN_138918-1 [Araneus ventricosus]|uniref:Uncharacterized protein n=1 Tax=Araneus ventricosus TaxID=182803 RepID=A0A4Y2QEC3_ARAVE|nr:hypothetical protein AVEN_138918-1 [Araneus ventricosus]
MVSSDGFLSNMVLRDEHYSHRIFEISLSHCFLPQTDRKCVGRKGIHWKDPRKYSLLLRRSFSLESVVACDIKESGGQYPVEPIVSKIVSLAKIRVLEMDSNDINVFVEEHNQELTTKEFMKLDCVSQQEQSSYASLKVLTFTFSP